MSNIDTAKAAHQAFRTGDLAALKDSMASDVVWWSSEETEPGGERHGVDEVMQMFMALPEHWKRFEVEANKFIDAGDNVVVLGTSRIENDRGSDVVRWAQVLTFNAEGKVAEAEMHSDTAKGYKLQH